ncbi:DUF2913 family protein [Vibrio parahaemolyticus]|uniref:DUF2913 family protein n=1 Tax=Vibrio parahaemolyticus TaxID=670 RepID=A0A9Q3UI86_VIBPH|nr:DUF2913 family protein [Vibrio parahaemolyticus]EGQ8101922.1 DUF2913 family protein [Vibrio parahaemolyticus]EGQ8548777.1 DUF2913 family protein [Vibrio parahaemolyticus]EGQ9073808.1 DUF2913 family protein [Vibrio parahaemolyticus]EGQ9129697.1 DUF2913 family protein [Vibrio parahaemolyticus]EGQ9286454.1 DUF2913 family protein [Vibrio parahaemolyticus]
MQIKRDFEYYHNLHNLVTHALLHLLSKVSETARHVPVSTRNEILVRYLKPKVNDKRLSNIKKDIKLMLNVARKQGGNLEMRLYNLNSQANRAKLAGAEKLYSLLVHLYDAEGIESRLFEEGSEAEPGILYMIEEQIEHGFDQQHKQVAPLSMLIQLERAPELIDSINRHGQFLAEMKEWNAETHQAHIVVHPN